MTSKTELQGFIETTWSDYCDLDYWIDELTQGGDTKTISKHVIKMAMKHLRDTLYDTHAYLCRIEERAQNMYFKGNEDDT
jgi:hypothetical protein